VDLVATHEFLGRALAVNPLIGDGCLVVAFSAHCMENPINRAKRARKMATRPRPRYFEAAKQAEADETTRREILAADELLKYARCIKPSRSPHSSAHSIDITRRSVVVSLCLPSDREAMSSLPQKDCEQMLRKCMGALPCAISTAFGLAPCNLGFACALRPCTDETEPQPSAVASTNRRATVDGGEPCPCVPTTLLSNLPKEPPPAPLRCCPVCLSKLSLLLLESGSAFSPARRERLMLAGFDGSPSLTPFRNVVEDDLNWSKDFLWALELELYGSSSVGSAALVAHKRSTQSFSGHHHKTCGARSIVDFIGARQQSTGSQANPPPYPGTERFRTRTPNAKEGSGGSYLSANQSPSFEGNSTKSLKTNTDLIWLENSLIPRVRHLKAVPGDPWVDPTLDSFGGIAPQISGVKGTTVHSYGEFQLSRALGKK
jgi:hypothetical protein